MTFSRALGNSQQVAILALELHEALSIVLPLAVPFQTQTYRCTALCEFTSLALEGEDIPDIFRKKEMLIRWRIRDTKVCGGDLGDGEGKGSLIRDGSLARNPTQDGFSYPFPTNISTNLKSQVGLQRPCTSKVESFLEFIFAKVKEAQKEACE